LQAGIEKQKSLGRFWRIVGNVVHDRYPLNWE
jgi:hypothetical protein